MCIKMLHNEALCFLIFFNRATQQAMSFLHFMYINEQTWMRTYDRGITEVMKAGGISPCAVFTTILIGCVL